MKKLSLKQLQVKSFVTALNQASTKTVQGGFGWDTQARKCVPATNEWQYCGSNSDLVEGCNNSLQAQCGG